ncbi:MAG: hypothetical protein Rubg2KO_20520 [Rubricoccaceae bacterium]
MLTPIPDMKIKAENVTAFAATLTAIAALFIAVWDNVQTREHNRLSVAPRLTVSTTVSNNTRSISLRNDGIGPAIVEQMTMLMQTESGQIETQDWQDIAPIFLDTGHSISSSWQFSPGDAVGIGASYALFGASESTDTTALSLREMVQDLSLRIEYASIYGDPFEVTYNWSESDTE